MATLASPLLPIARFTRVAALLWPLLGGAQPQSAMPAEIASSLTEARLSGQGGFRYFGLAVYQAKLWTTAGFAPAHYEQGSFALELQYERSLSGHRIADRSIEEMRRGADFDESRASAWRAALTQAVPDVQRGDRLVGLLLPDGTVRFFHNGRLTASLTDPTLARLFFGIWLAPWTSAPELRRQLLGAGS